MAGSALRGFGKVLRKHLKKVPVLGKRVRGTPTKAGLVSRRAALRGDKPTKPTYVEGVRKRIKGDKERETVGIAGAIGAAGAVGYTIGKSKAKKEAKAKETKEKLTKSVEEHKKKTKEQKEKQKK